MVLFNVLVCSRTMDRPSKVARSFEEGGASPGAAGIAPEELELLRRSRWLLQCREMVEEGQVDPLEVLRMGTANGLTLDVRISKS